MDYMDFIFRSRMRRDDSTEQTGTVEARKKLGFRGFFLEKKGKKVNEDIVPETYTSDYDVVMENYVYDEKRKEEISRIRERDRMSENFGSGFMTLAALPGKKLIQSLRFHLQTELQRIQV